MTTRMGGVTAEMIDWWFAWHGLESLRYKIWDPEEHFAAHVLEKDLEQRLDPRLSFRERNWGTTDTVNESAGTASPLLYISFMSPEDYGYDMERFKAANALTAVSANLGTVEPRTPLATFSHTLRAAPDGVEMRSRVWLGWNIIDRKPIRVLKMVPLEMVEGIAYHCPREYSDLAAILPELFGENVNVTDKLEDFRQKGD